MTSNTDFVVHSCVLTSSLLVHLFYSLMNFHCKHINQVSDVVSIVISQALCTLGLHEGKNTSRYNKILLSEDTKECLY